MAVTLTAKGIQHSGGSFANSGQSQTSAPFMYHHVDSGSYSFGGGWTTFMTTPDWKTPAKTQGICYWYVPTRNDNGNWGGMRLRHYYRINGGGWDSLGDSGYAQNDNTMSYSNSGRIDHQCQSQQFDFSNQTSDFTVAFRFDVTEHDGGGYINGDSNIDGGGGMSSDGYGGKHDADGNFTATGGNTGYSHCAWMGQGYA